MEVLGIAVAELHKIQTTTDGGSRVTIDLGEDSAQLVTKLMKYKLTGNALVSITITTDPESES